MSDDNDPGHGHSPAAWTAVIIMLIGFAAGTLAFWFAVPWLVWTFAGVVVLGPIVGAIMARAGYGVGGARTVPKTHS